MPYSKIAATLRCPSPHRSNGSDNIASSRQILSFSILGVRIRVECADPALGQVILANFGAMAEADELLPPDLDYSVRRSDASLALIRQGQVPIQAESAGDLLFLLEKDITLELQRKRSSHFFLHAAALAWRGKACLLAADTGSGKSFTTWALLHHGFEYLSDELSPIDLASMQVAPYSHALCLKQPPPPPYLLPDEAIHLGRTIHVPARSLPAATVAEPLALAAVFLLSYRPDLAAPDLRAVGAAEAAARLYVTALNALSHPNNGLDAVLRVAEQIPCFAVASADLARTCAMIRATVEDACGISCGPRASCLVENTSRPPAARARY